MLASRILTLAALSITGMTSMLSITAAARAADKPTSAASQATLAVNATGAPQFGTQVEAIKLTGLRPLIGKFVHVFYVSAREAAVGVEGSELKVRAVLQGPVRLEVPASGELELPAVRVPRKNFMTFNYLLVAVTGAEPSQLFLKNSDASPIEDARVKSPKDLEMRPERDFQVENKYFISAIRLAQLKTGVDLKDLR